MDGARSLTVSDCYWRRIGLSELELGRWSDVGLVKRYTKAYTFEDAATRYKAIV